jgi:hypothetical protein
MNEPVHMLPMDEEARSGKLVLVFDGKARRSIVKWNNARLTWIYPSGRQLEYRPVGYQPDPRRSAND